jgi:hypothetical protein
VLVLCEGNAASNIAADQIVGGSSPSVGLSFACTNKSR